MLYALNPCCVMHTAIPENAFNIRLVKIQGKLLRHAKI